MSGAAGWETYPEHLLFGGFLCFVLLFDRLPCWVFWFVLVCFFGDLSDDLPGLFITGKTSQTCISIFPQSVSF